MKTLGIRAAAATAIIVAAFIAVSVQQREKNEQASDELQSSLERLNGEAPPPIAANADGDASDDNWPPAPEPLLVRGAEPVEDASQAPAATALPPSFAAPPTAASEPPSAATAPAFAMPASQTSTNGEGPDPASPDASPLSAAAPPAFAVPSAPVGATSAPGSQFAQPSQFAQTPPQQSSAASLNAPTATAAPQTVDAAPVNLLRGFGDPAADTTASAAAEGTAAPATSGSDDPAPPPRVASLDATAAPALAVSASGEFASQASVARSTEANGWNEPPTPTASAAPADPAPAPYAPSLSNASDLARRSDGPRPTADPGLAAPPAEATLVEATPGERHLEGAQSPSVLIQKQAPTEVKVGQPAEFVITVENTGSVVARNVVVHDRVPLGTELGETVPEATRAGDLLIWDLGDLQPGNRRSLTMRLIPVEEGELGSVAQVSFNASASVRTISTRPDLKVVQRGPAEVLIGQQIEIEIEVSNPGSGTATGVVLREDVPQGLEHPKGRQLDNFIGDLAPGETRRMPLRLMATEAGAIKNVVMLESEEGLQVSHALDINVTSPQLILTLEGPGRRYLERRATYNLSIENTGSAMATNIDLVAYLDRGFSFVATDFKGQYDPQQHAVFWSLAELPAGEGGAVPLELLPVEPGDHAIRLEARADLSTVANAEKKVSVDTMAELTFAISDAADPIEVGSNTAYEVKLANVGTREDTNVQVSVKLPAGMQLVEAEGQTSSDGQGGIVFEALPRLAPGANYTYRFQVRGTQEGPQKINVTVESDLMPVAITKEEATLVYADE